jgi:Arc/MetJ-type ribon-helix-helix transcriptional regulator
MSEQTQPLKRMSVSLTERQKDSLDEMVSQKIYPSAAEGIRVAVALLEDKHGIYGKPAITPASPDMEVHA